MEKRVGEGTTAGWLIPKPREEQRQGGRGRIESAEAIENTGKVCLSWPALASTPSFAVTSAQTWRELLSGTDAESAARDQPM